MATHMRCPFCRAHCFDWYCQECKNYFFDYMDDTDYGDYKDDLWN